MDKKFSLRDFAKLIDVSSTYLSEVELGNYDPPTACRVKRIAELLEEDVDHWIGLADRLPDDLEPIIRLHPTTMPKLIRYAGQLSEGELQYAIELLQKRLCCLVKPR